MYKRRVLAKKILPRKRAFPTWNDFVYALMVWKKGGGTTRKRKLASDRREQQNPEKKRSAEKGGVCMAAVLKGARIQASLRPTDAKVCRQGLLHKPTATALCVYPLETLGFVSLLDDTEGSEKQTQNNGHETIDSSEDVV